MFVHFMNSNLNITFVYKETKNLVKMHNKVGVPIQYASEILRIN